MWFGSDATPDPAAAPGRQRRQQCWDARDGFFACLTANGIDNLLDPANAAAVKRQCAKPYAAFEGSCAASWVKYFQEVRYVEIKKQRLMDELAKKGIDPGFAKK